MHGLAIRISAVWPKRRASPWHDLEREKQEGFVTRLRIAVAGAGLIAQVEHIPNLRSLWDRFEVVAVADPSPSGRSLIEQRHGLSTRTSFDELIGLKPDAILIAAPDSYHAEFAGRTLEAGIHVFCEKPLCFSVADIDDLIVKRNAAKRVLQVGYMKRWDPSYEMLLDEIKELGPCLRFIAVEVNDPDSWPFSVHQGFQRFSDIPAALIADNKSRLAKQVALATGVVADDVTIRAYADSLASSMIHDLNVVLGLLEHMGVSDICPVSGSIFASGQGTAAVLALNGDQAICQISHVVVPNLADYQERISLFFDDRRFELIFPSPYLNHFQTRLIAYRSEGLHLSTTEHRSGFEEAFVRELIGFWESIVNGAPVRNTAEHARADIDLIQRIAKLALADHAR
jgi:predicted dehydrogenase